jgi:hypothetical protein
MKKLLVSYSSPELFGLSEKLQGTVTCTVKAGLLVSGLPGLGPLVDRNRTLEVLLAAGERAYGLYANDQAAHHFGAVLALIREGHRTELMPFVLEKLGEAWERVGETAAAIAVWSEARTLYERARNVSCSFVCTAAWH